MHKNKTIFLSVLSLKDENLLDQNLSESIDFYKDCKQLIDKTKIVLGRKKVVNFSLQSTTYGEINTKSISATSKI
jgi:hypothetical protein